MTHDFLPTASLDNLRARAALSARVHEYFQSRGFLHVETPLLSHDTVIDQHLRPIAVDAKRVFQSADQKAPSMFLQTSPEFAMKRLLAAGADAIYQIGKAFRHGERGRAHNPEFTMLEWYRVGDNLTLGMDFLSELVETMLDRPTTIRMTYAEAFQQFVNINLATAGVNSLRAACERHDVNASDSASTNRDEWLNLLLCSVIEPALAQTPAPKMIYNWPASQSALAIVSTDAGTGQPVAERFEIYVDGVELANGYHELLDPDELIRRNQVNNAARVADGATALPTDSRLLNAMQHGLPACAGVALGIDRLAMLAVGAQSIDEVIAFPIDRA